MMICLMGVTRSSLAAHDLSLTDPGIAFGQSSAAAILLVRANDHSSQAQFDYNAPGVGTPGVWVRLNNAAALLPGWGSVTPFVLRGASQFRPEPPPALDSERYAKDYNEIKEIGIVSGSSRSAEQSQIATFWRASPTAIWNPVLTQVVAARNFNLSDKARLFALLSIWPPPIRALPVGRLSTRITSGDHSHHQNRRS